MITYYSREGVWLLRKTADQRAKYDEKNLHYYLFPSDPCMMRPPFPNLACSISCAFFELTAVVIGFSANQVDEKKSCHDAKDKCFSTELDITTWKETGKNPYILLLQCCKISG